MDWKNEASCKGADTELFYPPRDRDKYTEYADQARAYCYGTGYGGLCPVIRECLLFALKTGETHGIWGGLSNRERRRLPFRRDLPAWISKDDLKEIGLYGSEAERAEGIPGRDEEADGGSGEGGETPTDEAPG